jgi:hypothetical protein
LPVKRRHFRPLPILPLDFMFSDSTCIRRAFAF